MDSRIVATLHPETLQAIGAEDGQSVRFSAAEGSIELAVAASPKVPPQCVVIPTATADSSALGAATTV